MTNDTPSLAVRHFGTDEPASPLRILKAGQLSAELDAGNLRHIRFAGIETIRAISFIVRDRNWGTYNPEIADLEIEESADGFAVSYSAITRDAGQTFSYRARITGSADGRLDFTATGRAETEFLTNRTGFVVLHPANLAGQQVTIEHADGATEQSSFPRLIDPLQPMMNLRALTHEPAPGLAVTCRMEGDVYEMEDQRNWTDASYKTYVRPLALPWPYTLAKGEEVAQAVRLSVSGSGGNLSAAATELTLSLKGRAGAFPQIGIGMNPAEIATTRENAATLARIGAKHVICFHDPRDGHDTETLRAAAETAQSIGAEAWLEAVIVDVDGYADEITALGRVVESIGSPFPTVLLSPAPDLKCTLPGSPWPPAPPPRAFFQAARQAFPNARLGGGMFSLFTEMNRKRPPADLLDFISFTTTAILHAGDDHSITEGLETLPMMALTATEIAGNKPWAVGPSAIGMRMNPYGDAPMANPGNIRQAMNYNDPRQRGLLGAAWTLGYIAHLAANGASAVAMGGTTGAQGTLHVPQPWPQPWFDDHGGLYPVFHVLRGLAGLSGATAYAVDISDPNILQAVAAEKDDGVELWIANLTAEEQTCRIDRAITAVATLDGDTFVTSAGDAAAMDARSAPPHTDVCILKPYAVTRLHLS